MLLIWQHFKQDYIDYFCLQKSNHKYISKDFGTMSANQQQKKLWNQKLIFKGNIHNELETKFYFKRRL